MSGNGYLFAAYAVTWIIHIAYLGTIVSRYSRLKGRLKVSRRNKSIETGGLPRLVRQPFPPLSASH